MSFEKTDPSATALPLAAYEKLFLVALFTELKAGTVVRLSSLKGSFYPYLATIRNSIYASMTSKNLFRHDPEQTRTIYFGAAGCFGLVAFCAFVVSVPTAVGLLVACLIVASFAPAMPARTSKGSALTREALGFARFVKKAEQERIKVLAAEDPTIFRKAFTLRDGAWCSRSMGTGFSKIFQSNRLIGTCLSSDYPSYSTSLFLNDLGASLRSVEQTFSSSPVSETSTSSAWSGGSAFDGGWQRWWLWWWRR